MASVGRPVGTGSERRRRSVVGPIILIGLGALFLAQNLGMVNGNLWVNIWRFWPVLLILGGVELIFGGRAGWMGTALTAAVAVAAVGIVAWATVAGSVPYWTGNGWWTGPTGPAAVERLSEEIGSVRQATVNLRHNSGSLTVGALPADSTRLVEGELNHPDSTSIYRRFDRRGDQGELRLRDPERQDFPFVANAYNENWNLRLSPAVAFVLQVETGASQLTLDLRDLKVTSLRVEAGASAVNVTMPQAAGRTNAIIKAGAAGVDVTVPEGVAARINSRSGLSGVSIDESRFPRVGNNLYQSTGYDTATNKVDLTIETGVSGVTVR